MHLPVLWAQQRLLTPAVARVGLFEQCCQDSVIARGERSSMLQEMALQEESSALSVRSRRRKPYKRPRPEPEEEGARQPPSGAAALRRADAPALTRSQAGQQAADQPGGEPTEAPGVPDRAGEGAGGQTPVRARLEIEQEGTTRQSPGLAPDQHSNRLAPAHLFSGNGQAQIPSLRISKGFSRSAAIMLSAHTEAGLPVC